MFYKGTAMFWIFGKSLENIRDEVYKKQGLSQKSSEKPFFYIINGQFYYM